MLNKKISRKMKKVLFILLTLTCGMFSSCENGDWEFPDYEYQTVYFAYQSPIRTITLGEDFYDTTLDNLHQCQIMATMGGVYSNKKNVEIGIAVDNSICDNLNFDNGNPVKAMPSSYYTLSGDKITIKKGEILGGVTVQLTDAFFADPEAVNTNYVIPVKMTSVNGADSILSGIPLTSDARYGVAEDWEVLPKNYILYAVKYINQYDAVYLRRGVDNYSGGIDGTTVRHGAFVEKDEVVDGITTRSLNTIAWAHPAKDAEGTNMNAVLLLTFDASGNCTITSDTEGITATGSGQYVVDGDKKSWGNEDRDALYLDYTLEYAGIKCQTKDTLVVRDRGVRSEWFSTVAK